MSETTPGETPVERRLRVMTEHLRASDASDDVLYAAAIDAGREALKLLAEIRGECSSRDLADMLGTALLAKLDALLARCEGDR